MERLIELMESRIRRNVYVRFGGEHLKTYHSNMERRWVLSLQGIGIAVEYGDVEGWVKAIRYLSTHPEKAREMGENARQLGEKRFNLEIFSKEIAQRLLHISTKNS